MELELAGRGSAESNFLFSRGRARRWFWWAAEITIPQLSDERRNAGSRIGDEIPDRGGQPSIVKRPLETPHHKFPRGTGSHDEVEPGMTVPHYSWDIPNLRGPDGPSKPPTEAYCTHCNQWKPLAAFSPNRKLRTGLQSWCRMCQTEATRQWRASNREYMENYNERRRREYRAAHPLPVRACVVCGKSFTKRPNALVCGEDCRRKRKMEQRKRPRTVA